MFRADDPHVRWSRRSCKFRAYCRVARLSLFIGGMWGISLAQRLLPRSIPLPKRQSAGFEIDLFQAPQSAVTFFTYIQQSPMHPHLIARVTKDATLVKFAIGDLDEHAIHSVKEQLTELAGGIGPIELRLDFEKIETMGSSALAMLVSINRKVARNDGHVIVLNVADHLVKLFKLTRLDTILDIRPRRGDGLHPTRALA